MRPIDADALLKKIEEDSDFYLAGDDENSKAVGGALLGVKEQINTMPTVEPQKVKGKWIKLFAWRYICSECGDWWTDGNFHFCPNCGADMRKEQDETNRC